MDAGLDFRDRAVVDLDLRGFALDEDALNDLAARRHEDPLSDRGVSGAEGERNFSGSVTGVAEIDGYQPIPCLSG